MDGRGLIGPYAITLPDYPTVSDEVLRERREVTPLGSWYTENPEDVVEFERQMRRKAHYVIEPHHLWAHVAHLARTQSDDLLNTLQSGFKYIENESFQSTFAGLFSEINLASKKLGKTSLQGPGHRGALPPSSHRWPSSPLAARTKRPDAAARPGARLDPRRTSRSP